MKFFEDCEGITEPQGFFASGVPCNVMGKNNGKLDLGLLYSPRACTAAGTFTTNDVKASPVLYCMDLLNDPKQNFHGVLTTHIVLTRNYSSSQIRLVECSINSRLIGHPCFLRITSVCITNYSV